MEKRFIGLGVASGIVAGLLSFAYARAQLSPLIDTAVGYEEGRSHAEELMTGDHSHSHEIFSRSLQENVGAGVGTVVFGIIMGALFAVAFTVLLAVLRRQWPAIGGPGVAVALAAGAFLSTSVLPALSYPPNPPGVGLEETIGDRTTAYLMTVIASVVLAAGAVALGMRLASRIGGWRAAMVSCAGYLLAMSVAIGLAPAYQEVPRTLTDATGTIVFPGFPAEVLSEFRIGSLVSQAVLWAAIGAVFAVGLPRVTPAAAAAHTAEVRYDGR
jgi:hypothetical protein